jgi:hypothetical protein
MNRRNFIRSAAALAAATALPTPPSKDAIAQAMASLRFVLEENARLFNDNWMCVIHPSAWVNVREIAARCRWEFAYRRYRIALRDGRCESLDAREILEQFHDRRATDIGSRPLSGELGRIEGIRFITERNLVL